MEHKCPNCKIKMTVITPPDGKSLECTKCGLLMFDDGQVIYNPKDPKWISLGWGE